MLRFGTPALLALASLLSSAHATAQDWRIFHITVNETREIDRASVRIYEGVCVYQIRVRADNGRFGYDRTVATDCQGRQRFELLASSDWIERPFKTVYPDTALAKEISIACELPTTSALSTDLPPQVVYRRAEAPTPAPQPTTSSRAVRTTGSGFFVSAAEIITNQHVVDGCSTITVKLGTRTLAAKLVVSDPRIDLALLQVLTTNQLAPSIRTSPELGEDIMVAGFPLAGVLGTDIVVTGGQINSLAGILNDSTLIQISAPVQPGNSGGPVFDKSGAVVGVVVSKLNVERLFRMTGDIAQNINFAVKPQMLALFLDANQVQYSVAKRGAPLDGVSLATRARGVTVQVLCAE